MNSKFNNRAAGNPYSLVLNAVALVICYRGLKTVTNYELPLVLASAGHKQFLTILSLFVSIATFALSVLSHLTKSQKLFTLKNDVHAIATTLETIVSGVYWPLKLFFIKMILDREKIAPLSVDLAIHLVPTVTLLVDFYCFMPNWKVNDGAAMSIVALLTVAYWQWLNYVMDETSVFPYPFLNVSFKARLLIFDVIGSVAFGNFLLQKWIYKKVIRGAEVAEEKVQKVVDKKEE